MPDEIKYQPDAGSTWYDLVNSSANLNPDETFILERLDREVIQLALDSSSAEDFLSRLSHIDEKFDPKGRLPKKYELAASLVDKLKRRKQRH